MNKGKVSVVMSTYNTEETKLGLAIKSILNQTYTNFEFIIVNDGGSNLNFLKRFKDERIIILNHEKSMGLPLSLNDAINIAQGEYIVRMDSDDYSLPKRIEIQKKFMDKNKNIDVCGTYYKYFDDSNNLEINVLNDYKCVKCQMFGKNSIAHPTAMIRKSFIDKYNLRYSIDYKYSQDFELWTRCLNYGNIAIVPSVCFLYRIHSNQISSKKKQEQMNLYEKVLRRNLENIKLDYMDIKYLKMLNGLVEVDFTELSNFIDKAIKHNNKYLYYDKRVFKNIMYYYFFVLVLKNKKKFLHSPKNIKIIKKTLNIFNIVAIVRKSFGILWWSLIMHFQRMEEI